MITQGYPVRSQYRSDSASQLITRPVESLLSVGADAKSMLNELGISVDLNAAGAIDVGDLVEASVAGRRNSAGAGAGRCCRG